MMMPDLYRKKPVTIEAMQVTDDIKQWNDVYEWVARNTLGRFNCLPGIEGDENWPESGVSIDPCDGRMVIANRGGGYWVNPGDYVVRGVRIEFYPVKEPIFLETYEAVDDND